MSFLYPAFLLGGIAIALPIVLHLLRRDVAPEVLFSAVRLLRRSPIERTRRRRLRDLVLLAARIAALALLAVSFARPYLTTAASGQGLHIVAVDRSFSMSGAGRFARALELAGGVVSEAGVRDRVAVIAFDDRADVVAQPGSAADARAALAGLEAGFGGTRFGPAFAKAIEMAGSASANLVVITDLQRVGWEDEEPLSVPPGLQVDVRDAGAPPPNAAVMALHTEPERVIATIANSSNAPFTGAARLRVDGREVASAVANVPADEAVDVVIPYRAGKRGALAVAIDDPKGLGADNARYAVLEPPLRTRIMIVTTPGAAESGLYLAGALKAAEDHSLDVRIVSGSQASSLSADDLTGHSAIALLSTRGLDRRGRDLVRGFVHGGAGLLIFAGDDVEPQVLASMLNPPRLRAAEHAQVLALSASNVRHPVFQPFGSFAANLGQVRFDRIWKIDPKDWDIAARFTDGSPALVERREGRGRVMVFASDVDRRWNEFPQHPAFVPFAVESIRYIAGTRERARDFLVADVPAGAQPAPGVYTLPDGRTIAVNVDTRESSGARLTSREFTDMVVRSASAPPQEGVQEATRARNVESRQNLWQYGLVLMLVALVVESALGRS